MSFLSGISRIFSLGKPSAPLLGERSESVMEIRYYGKNKWTYYGHVEKLDGSYSNGKQIRYYRLLAKHPENCKIISTIDQDLISESEIYPYSRTIRGQSSTFKSILISSMITYAFLIYFILNIGSISTAVSTPSGQASESVAGFGIIFSIAFLLIYGYLKARSFVHVCDIQPLTNEEDGKNLPVYLENSTKALAVDYLQSIGKIPGEGFKEICSGMKQFESDIITNQNKEIKLLNRKLTIANEAFTVGSLHSLDDGIRYGRTQRRSGGISAIIVILLIGIAAILMFEGGII